MIKKHFYFLFILLPFFCFFSSCTLSTSIPHYEKGVWIRWDESGDFLDHQFEISDGNTYIHTVATSDQETVSFKGFYEIQYTSFSVLDASGTIQFVGKTEDESQEESEIYSFIIEANAEQGLSKMTLVNNSTKKELNLRYLKGAVWKKVFV